ncbi:MAG: phospholipid carrier-dependent glycosyltransferase, partial [Verrucomicrobia bacterium]
MIGAAAWLRFADLGHKIIHADEAVQGWKTGLLLEGEGYAYDPTDHHGPTLYYLAVPIAQLRGEDSLNDLTVTTLRILPALAGVGVVALTAAGGFWLGGRGALAAALVAAASPMLVFYSRHFVQEMLLVLFSAAWVLALWRWLLGGRPAWLLIAGWALGLMIATKETWLIVVFATGMGSVAALWCDRGLRARAFSREAIVFGAGGLVAAAVVAAIIYTAAFSRPEVLGDVFKALLVGSERAGDGAGHAKPWSYYFTTLAWTRLRGFTYTEAGVFLLALASLPLAFRSPRGDSRTAASRFWLGYTGAMLMVYSLIPYKTIWLLCGAMHGLAMLAGLGVDTLLDRFRRPLSRSIVAIIAVGILADYAWQARRA